MKMKTKDVLSKVKAKQPHILHDEFINQVEDKLKSEGYKIIGREIHLPDIVVRGHRMRVDLMVEKDGKTTPVECGVMSGSKEVINEKKQKLVQKFGSMMHIPYGDFAARTVIQIDRMKVVRELCTYKTVTLKEYINRLIAEDMTRAGEYFSICYFKGAEYVRESGWGA